MMKRVSKILGIIMPFVSLCVVWFELELGNGYSSKSSIFQMENKYLLLNLCTVAVIYAMLVIMTNRIWSAGIILHSFFLVVAVVNYYTVKLHGLPFTIHELANARTAFRVMGGHGIRMDRYVLSMIVLSAVCVLVYWVCRKSEKYLTFRKACIRDTIMAAMAALFVYFGYASPNSIKPHTTLSWNWWEPYQTYGYLPCSIESIAQTFHIYNMPEGYSEEKAEGIAVNQMTEEGKKPDIILILNETFYDLGIVSDIKTDRAYLENFYALDNAVHGYAVVPFVGGGTNHSEYELLTSNSIYLFNSNVTPFNVLGMKNENSIVSYLKQMGYWTIGAHASIAENYNRERAYPNMGFDQTFFIDDFTKTDYYGQRKLLSDRAVYENFYSWYEGCGEGQPRFAYLLTIQNHSPWETNEAGEDVVHLNGGYGSLTESVNEYLSCIYQSDQAFRELTEYIEGVDRPVLVCMVGDHSPWFAEDLVSENISEEEKQIGLRSTPFVIWANYDIESRDVGTVSLNNIVPLILETGGIETSVYYQYMLDLMKQVPVLTSYGCYLDTQGNVYRYDEENGYTNDVNDYFYLEYYNISDGWGQEQFTAQ